MSMELPSEFISDTTCGDNYAKGWRVTWFAFVPLLAVNLIFAVIKSPTDPGARIIGETSGHVLKDLPPEIAFSAIAGFTGLITLYSIFLLGPITMSVSWVFLKAARKEEVLIGDMFSVFQRNYWNAVAAGLVKGILVIAGLLFFIIPGIVLACRFAFVNYLIIDRKMGALESLSASWEMTKGHGWTIFGMALLTIPIVLIGLLAMIVGVFVASVWISAAFAVLYHSVCVREWEPVNNYEGFEEPVILEDPMQNNGWS